MDKKALYNLSYGVFMLATLLWECSKRMYYQHLPPGCE